MTRIESQPQTVAEARNAESRQLVATVFRRGLPVARQLVFAGALGLVTGGFAFGDGRTESHAEFIGWAAVVVGLCIPLRRSTWRNL